jgi:hypothetical protein
VFCTDRRVEALSVIVTPSRTLVLSPFDPAAFRRELIRRIEANEPPAEPIERRRPSFGLPHPAVAGLIGVACALLLASLLDILASLTRLPDMIALQLDPAGRPGPLSPRSEIFNLPLLGAALLVLNILLALALRGREQAATVLLCATASLIEIVILLATLRLLP